jgi:hypothetical protein
MVINWSGCLGWKECFTGSKKDVTFLQKPVDKELENIYTNKVVKNGDSENRAT